jgi:L-amino acid N-acyltransferase YncA
VVPDPPPVTSGSRIRLATPEDAPAVQGIYAPAVRDTAISFEAEPPTAAEMRARITAILGAGLPWLVYEEADGRVVGYTYAARWRARDAYRWTVEASVYVHTDYQRRGIGRALYTSLFRILALQGYRTVVAGATLPNPGSVILHEQLGFRTVGVFRAVGYKFGVWHDVLWWQLAIGAHPVDPPVPLTLAEARESPGWSAALAAGVPLLHLAGG